MMLMFSTTFNNIAYYFFFVWQRKPKKTTDLSQDSDKIYHTMLYRLHIAMVGNQTQLWKALNMNVDVNPITILSSSPLTLWFSPVSSTNKTDCHDIAEICLKVAINTINQLTTDINFSQKDTYRNWLCTLHIYV